MRFLVDENLPVGIIAYLASLKHDVFDVASSQLRGAPDRTLWQKAASEERILITRDLDYPIPGQRPAPYGVILLRVPMDYSASSIVRTFIDSVGEIEFETLRNKVAVIRPGRIRISALP